jgi:hypothetical protein
VRRSDPMSDTDGLQADVMRFMAIIALCMVAIMALVGQLGDAPVVAPLQGAQSNRQLPLPVTMGAPRVSAPSAPVKAPVDSEPTPVAMSVRDLSPVSSKGSPDPGARKPTESVRPSSEKSSDNASDNSSESTGLTLRFASDRVFLGMIAAGRIKVYVRDGAGFVELSPALDTRAGKPAGQLYELVGPSVPALVRKVLGEADIYLVVLPQPTQRAIARYARDRQVVSDGGALVIHGNGEVRHET